VEARARERGATDVGRGGGPPWRACAARAVGGSRGRAGPWRARRGVECCAALHLRSLSGKAQPQLGRRGCRPRGRPWGCARRERLLLTGVVTSSLSPCRRDQALRFGERRRRCRIHAGRAQLHARARRRRESFRAAKQVRGRREQRCWSGARRGHPCMEAREGGGEPPRRGSGRPRPRREFTPSDKLNCTEREREGGSRLDLLTLPS
jgi:hypothetical protein